MTTPIHTTLLTKVIDLILGGYDVHLFDHYPTDIDEIRKTRRFYHNSYHIFDCIGFLWKNRDGLLPVSASSSDISNNKIDPHQLQDLLIITIALYYHDVIYNPTASDNEEQSAIYAEKTLGEFLLSLEKRREGQKEESPQLWSPSQTQINIISDLIIATKRHGIPDEWLKIAKGEEIDAGVVSVWKTAQCTLPSDQNQVTAQTATHLIRLVSALLDVDLSILSVNSSRFEIYDKQIRQEYQHYPIEDYKVGRSSVMKNFAQRPELYFTNWSKKTLLAPAQRNLELIAAEKYEVGNGWDDEVVIQSIWDFCPDHYADLILVFNDIINILEQHRRNLQQKHACDGDEVNSYYKL